MAKGLGLLTTASQADTQQMIEGKLAEDHEPKNAQVDVIELDGGVMIKLRDKNGVILEIPPEEGDGKADGEAQPTSEGVSETEDEGSQREAVSRGARDKVTSRMRELELELAREHSEELKAENKRTEEENTRLLEEVSHLRERLKVEREKYTTLWRMNCEQLIEHDSLISSKDEEVEHLRARITELEAGSHASVEPTPVPIHFSKTRTDAVVGVRDPVVPIHVSKTRTDTVAGVVDPVTRTEHTITLHEPKGGREHVVDTSHPIQGSSASSKTTPGAGEGERARRGKAPPVDSFSGESPDILFEDWLPALQRAAEWNGWSKEETLIQLAGHLRGRALQEWGLLSAREKLSLDQAIIAMRNRLDPCSRALAAQDFRHASQREGESVSDFIRRLEQMFKLAYGQDGMSDETRGTLLHSQKASCMTL